NTSLGVVPSGSVMRTLPVNTSDGSVYVNTFPETSPLLGAAAGAPPHIAPVSNVQAPFSSVNVIVKARAGADAKLSPTVKAANAKAPSTIRFMIVPPLKALSHPPPRWLLKSPLVNLSQGVIFWTTSGMAQKSGRCDLRVNEYMA